MYVQGTSKIISSYDVVFYERCLCKLEYTSQPYEEAMDVRPDVSYTPYYASTREKTGNLITFA